MPKVSLALAIHAHQPMGNFENVMEDAYQRSYLPFVQVLARHPQIKMALHFTGSLLYWFKQHHPEYLTLLGRLVADGQIELISGGFYEPILAILPYEDRVAQIHKLNEFLKSELGYQPQGMWTAERVWESNLVTAIKAANIEYTILDDTHFQMAGLRDQQLFGYYVTEEQGQTLKLVPSSMKVRYLLPFAEPQATIDYLRNELAQSQTNLLVAMGDDTEKFGVWPKTYKCCYTDGWLDRFYDMLAQHSDWLETVRLADYLKANEPSGRIYLPTASYAEMLEWALPAQVSQEFVDLKHQLTDSAHDKRLAQYLHGGYWRNFLIRYRESNLIHKQMLQVSNRARQLQANHKIADQSTSERLNQAYDYVLQGQCNDAFWHGVFGGLYAPHLRSALLMSLIKAEQLLDSIEFSDQSSWLVATEQDFDADGCPEVVIQTPIFSAVYDPKEGGVSILDFKPSNFSLINCLQRRPEAYHQKIRDLATQEALAAEALANQPLTLIEGVFGEKIDNSAQAETEAVETIHEITRVKEKGLERFLIYDQYPRNCFTVYALAPTATLHNFATQQLTDTVAIYNSDHYEVIKQDETTTIEIDKLCSVRSLATNTTARLSQRLQFSGHSNQIVSSLALAPTEDPQNSRWAIEFHINLLAGDAHDRYWVFPEAQHRLNWQGEVLAQSSIKLVDEYFQVAVELRSDQPIDWWIYPIFSVSQSEEGFERVYQGSAILAVTSQLPIELTLTAHKP